MEEVTEFFKSELPKHFIDTQTNQMVLLKHNKEFQQLIQDKTKEENIQLSSQQELSQDQVDTLIEQYNEVQKLKNNKEIIDQIIQVDQAINQINSISNPETCLKKLLKSLQLLTSSMSKLKEYQEDIEEKVDNNKEGIRLDKWINFIIKIKIEVRFNAQLNLLFRLNDNDKEGIKQLIEMFILLRQNDDLLVQVGIMVFQQQVQQLKYHFLNKESELNTIEKPNWLFKNILDYIQFLSPKIKDLDNYKVFFEAYLQVVSQVIIERYQLDASLNQAHTKITFLLYTLEFDQEYQQYLPNDTNFSCFDQVLHKYPQDLELVYQDFEVKLVNEVKTIYKNHSAKNMFSSIIPDKIMQIQRQIQSVKKYQTLVVQQLFDPLSQQLIFEARKIVNNNESYILELQTKQNFLQFLQILNAVKVCERAIKQTQQQYGIWLQSYKDVKAIKNSFVTILLEHLMKKIITFNQQMEYLDHEVIKEIHKRLSSYLNKVKVQIDEQVSKKWSIKVTLLLLIRLKEYIRQNRYQGSNINMKQQLSESLTDLTNLVQNNNIDFSFI